MTSEPTTGTPEEMPASLYEAFQAIGDSPVTVIMIPKEGEGEPKTYVRNDAFQLIPTQAADPEALTAPHMTMQTSDITIAPYRLCLWCTRSGCYWIPC